MDVMEVVKDVVENHYMYLFHAPSNAFFSFALSTKPPKIGAKRLAKHEMKQNVIKQGVHIDFSMICIDNSTRKYTELFKKFLIPVLSEKLNKIKGRFPLIWDVDAASVYNGWPVYGCVKSSKLDTYTIKYICKFPSYSKGKAFCTTGNVKNWLAYMRMHTSGSDIHPMHVLDLCFPGRKMISFSDYSLCVLDGLADEIPLSIYTEKDVSEVESRSSLLYPDVPVDFYVAIADLLSNIHLPEKSNATKARLQVAMFLKSIVKHYELDDDAMFEEFKRFSCSRVADDIESKTVKIWSSEFRDIDVTTAFSCLLTMIDTDTKEFKASWCGGLLSNVHNASANTTAAYLRSNVHDLMCITHIPTVAVHGKFVNQEIFKDGCANIVKSPLGSGKTTAVIEYVKEREARSKGQICIIVVGPRVSFCTNIFERFRKELSDILPVVFYKDSASIELANQSPGSWLLVIQYESVYKLDFISSKELIVIIDESESMLTQMFSSTNGHKQSENIKRIQSLCVIPSSTLIMMDAFITDRSIIFARECKGSDTVVHLSSSVQERREVDIYTTKSVLVEELRNDLNNGKRVYLFCTHKRDIADVLFYLEENGVIFKRDDVSLHRKDVSVHTGDESDKIVDVNTSWSASSGVKLICCTSTVTVGVNYDLGDIDVLYGIANTGACVVRDMFQSLARIRYPTEKSLKLFVGIDGSHTKLKIDAMEEYIDANIKASVDHIDTMLKKKIARNMGEYSYIKHIGKTVQTERILSDGAFRTMIHYYLRECNYALRDVYLEKKKDVSGKPPLMKFNEVPDDWTEEDDSIKANRSSFTLMDTLRYSKSLMKRIIKLDGFPNEDDIEQAWAIWNKPVPRDILIKWYYFLNKKNHVYSDSISELSINSDVPKTAAISTLVKAYGFKNVADRDTVVHIENIDGVQLTGYESLFGIVKPKQTDVQRAKVILAHRGLDIIQDGKSHNIVTGFRLTNKKKLLNGIDICDIKDDIKILNAIVNPFDIMKKNMLTANTSVKRKRKHIEKE